MKTRRAALFLTFGLCIALVLSALVASGQAAPKEPPPRVLMIGDSLSVGPFGESVEQYLETRLGRSNFALLR